MKLRPFEDTDRHAVKDWFEAEGGHWVGGLKWLDSATQQADERPAKHKLYVGERDGEAVSVISASWVRGEPTVIVSIVVSPNVRCDKVATETGRALRDAPEFADAEQFLAYLDPRNEAVVALVKALGLSLAAEVEPGRKIVYAGRRDGGPLPDDWQLPDDQALLR